MSLKLYLLPVLAMFALTFSSCSKKDGSSNIKPEEEGLKISLENVTESGYTASPGATYTFSVKVTSAMPTEGVNVKITAVTDPGGMPVPQNAIAPTKDGTINITLTGLEPIQTVLVTVVVTSAGNTSNTATAKFYITNKEAQ